MDFSRLSLFGLSVSPRAQLHLQRSDGIETPAVGRGRRFWVISRALCRFFKVTVLSDASTAQQLEALKLQIDRLSPFAETGSHVHLGADAIAVWVWDAGAARDAAAEVGVDLRRFTILPETALQPPGDGPRLVRCLDGVEGQCWESGSLRASRWWPTAPDDRNWVLFQRGGSVGPDRIATETPPAMPLPWLTRSWTNSASTGWAGVAKVDLRLAAAVIGVAFMVGYAYLGAEWARVRWDLAKLDDKVAASSTTNVPILHAREKAMAAQTAITRLHALNPYPGQLSLMAEVAEILPKNETHFTDWAYDHGRLEVTLGAGHPLDATFFVRALDRAGRFRQVSAERIGSDNSLRVRLTVEPR